MAYPWGLILIQTFLCPMQTLKCQADRDRCFTACFTLPCRERESCYMSSGERWSFIFHTDKSLIPLLFLYLSPIAVPWKKRSWEIIATNLGQWTRAGKVWCFEADKEYQSSWHVQGIPWALICACNQSTLRTPQQLSEVKWLNRCQKPLQEPRSVINLNLIPTIFVSIFSCLCDN